MKFSSPRIYQIRGDFLVIELQCAEKANCSWMNWMIATGWVMEIKIANYFVELKKMDL
jgi:hypothetical protein